jgi:hypothetical protein
MMTATILHQSKSIPIAFCKVVGKQTDRSREIANGYLVQGETIRLSRLLDIPGLGPRSLLWPFVQ